MGRIGFRGALTAAAMLFVTVFGAEPSSAWAQDTSPAPEQAGMPAATGREWIAQGTVQAAAAPDAAVPAAIDVPIPQADSLRELVGDMPVDVELSAELTCVAQAVYFEARGEPLDGQLAVAEVIINRATSGRYPSDYCAVVTQPAQFSFVRRGRIPAVDTSSDSWRRAKAVAQIAQQDLWESKAIDALYFHAAYVRPGWARQKVQLAQIDTHIFYR